MMLLFCTQFLILWRCNSVQSVSTVKRVIRVIKDGTPTLSICLKSPCAMCLLKRKWPPDEKHYIGGLFFGGEGGGGYTSPLKKVRGILLYPPQNIWVSVSVPPSICLSVHPSVSASFPGSVMSIYLPIFFKLCTGVHIRKEWFRIEDG